MVVLLIFILSIQDIENKRRNDEVVDPLFYTCYGFSKFFLTYKEDTVKLLVGIATQSGESGIKECAEVELVRGAKVVVLSDKQWERVCMEFGGELPWHTCDGNLLVQYPSFGKPSKGSKIYFQEEVILQIVGRNEFRESWEKKHPGLKNALAMETDDWRSGVICEVLQGGTLTLYQDLKDERTEFSIL
jgi:hypothetical protein